MWRALALGLLLALTLVGCTTPGPKLGPPPNPWLATRAPRQVAPLPPAPAPPDSGAALPPRSGGGYAYPGAGSLRGHTIVVDPGHGGKDPGALGRGPAREKAINLDIATRLAERLREAGANVVMTRSSDRFIELDERSAIANRTRCDLFISIHADSAKRTTAEGLTAYIARGTGGQSLRAANHIGAALRRAGFDFNGVRGAGYRVLVDHNRPAVLIECGYVTNRSEAQRLATGDYREHIADAIAAGIAAHFTQ